MNVVVHYAITCGDKKLNPPDCVIRSDVPIEVLDEDGSMYPVMPTEAVKKRTVKYPTRKITSVSPLTNKFFGWYIASYGKPENYDADNTEFLLKLGATNKQKKDALIAVLSGKLKHYSFYPALWLMDHGVELTADELSTNENILTFPSLRYFNYLRELFMKIPAINDKCKYSPYWTFVNRSEGNGVKEILETILSNGGIESFHYCRSYALERGILYIEDFTVDENIFRTDASILYYIINYAMKLSEPYFSKFVDSINNNLFEDCHKIKHFVKYFLHFFSNQSVRRSLECVLNIILTEPSKNTRDTRLLANNLYYRCTSTPALEELRQKINEKYVKFRHTGDFGVNSADRKYIFSMPDIIIPNDVNSRMRYIREYIPHVSYKLNIVNQVVTKGNVRKLVETNYKTLVCCIDDMRNIHYRDLFYVYQDGFTLCELFASKIANINLVFMSAGDLKRAFPHGITETNREFFEDYYDGLYHRRRSYANRFRNNVLDIFGIEIS